MKLSRKFYAKTWVLWAQVLIFGQLALVGCIAGPLFWLDIAKPANGHPGHEAGIPLTIISYVVILPIFILSASHLLVFQKPVIVLFKEGLETRCMASKPGQSLSSVLTMVLNLDIITIPLSVIYRLITFQKLVDIPTYKIPWSEIDAIYVTMIGLNINGRLYDDSNGQMLNTDIVSFDRNIFESPEYVCKTLEHYYVDPALREQLPTWEAPT